MSRARFEELMAADAFLEWADVFGNLYGTSAADAERDLQEGRDLVLVIDVQGARQVRRRYPDTVGVSGQSYWPSEPVSDPPVPRRNKSSLLFDRTEHDGKDRRNQEQVRAGCAGR